MNTIDKLNQYNKLFKEKDIEAIIEEIENECDKISIVCGMVCTMGQDMELIKREVKDYAPYEEVVARNKRQLLVCPKICPKYKEV